LLLYSRRGLFFTFFLLLCIVIAGGSLASKLIEEVGGTLSSHRFEFRLFGLLYLRSSLLFLFRFEEFATEALLNLLDDLGLVVAEGFKEVVEFPQVETLHDCVL
jgi:hypothetical protein